MSSKLFIWYENFKFWLILYESLWWIQQFVNNVYSHFVKIIMIFYDRLMDTKYIIIAIFIIFEQKLDITTIIIF
jgi:hypothetical protein